ncbi:hypothetical protein MNBD_CHLOROFLEXI01-3302 [hydrothermal vent metagenome]|uniref:Uncharacterized protein n=1 Tax=hydrothermal vent metagenome TaxID=652676 RepID=A0A3B0V498_9ZZZZ
MCRETRLKPLLLIQIWGSPHDIPKSHNFESTLPIYQHDQPPGGDDQRSYEPPGGLGFSDDARAQLHTLYADLTDGQPRGRQVITCRPQQTGLRGVKELPLGGLSRPDSLYLLAAILDQKSIDVERAGYEREAMTDLLNKLDDHPLSIELVAPHLKTTPPAQIVAEFDEMLPQFSDADAHEGRNSSLLTSLAFSQRRLGAAAQRVWPYLGWFDGGVFEMFLLDFAEMEAAAWAAAWAAARTELVETALIRVEELPGFNTLYLRFHPTLTGAARLDANRDADDTMAARFVDVYRQVNKMAHDALFGKDPAWGMALMAREEANLRRAAALAFQQKQRSAGGDIANTLGEYLQRAGRLRERDGLTAWAKAQLTTAGELADGGLDAAACAAILQHVWTRFTQGEAAAAIADIQALLTQLQADGLRDGGDPTLQLAMGHLHLGRIYDHAGRSDLAIAPLQQAIKLFEDLTGLQNLSGLARGNLAAALGDLANAYMTLGQMAKALQTAERALAINRDMGREREIVVGLTRIAQILTAQNRYQAAAGRYDEALAARQVGDGELEGSILQQMGSLHDKQRQHDQAVGRYRQALTRFQQIGDQGNEMRTCDLLASAEMQRGQLDAAAAWYERAHELAVQLGDQRQLAAIAQNRGILSQTRAQNSSDPARRAAYLRQAAVSIEESLAIWLEMDNQPNAAASYGQLGKIYRLLGEFDKAEENLLQAMQIEESLNLPDVYITYHFLFELARDRGDAAAAAAWQAKRDAKIAELEARNRADSQTSEVSKTSEVLVQNILALAQAAYNARVANAPLLPEVGEALAHLMEQPEPLGQVGLFLAAVAANEPVAAVPAGLPPQLADILHALQNTL